MCYYHVKDLRSGGTVLLRLSGASRSYIFQMLPSMPILFSRESQDAFGNKIEPSTSFFNPNSFPKPVINPKVGQRT